MENTPRYWRVYYAIQAILLAEYYASYGKSTPTSLPPKLNKKAHELTELFEKVHEII